MKYAALRWLFFAAAATIAFVVARAVAPGRQELELDVYILVLGAFALLVLGPVLESVAPSEDESEVEAALAAESPKLPRIAELDRLGRELELAAGRDFDLYYRLRPVLQEIAAARLEHRGLRLDSDSSRVRDLLGEQAWALAAEERKPPEDRQAPGPGLEALQRTVEQLERL